MVTETRWQRIAGPVGPRNYQVMDRPGEVLVHGPVTLRRWRAADAGTMCDLVLGSLEHLRPWLLWAADYGPLAAARSAARCEQDWESGAAFHYAITTGGAPVGGCSLHARIAPGGVEIGYWVAARHTRQGLATGAVAALVGAAFGLGGVEWVEIVVDEANVASSGVPRKLGFTAVARRARPGGPRAPGESDTTVVWRLTRPLSD